MPGYRALPEHMSGLAVERTREASVLEQLGEHDAALIVYEDALAETVERSPVLPGYLCGRLAALDRRLGRYDDEVALLERYRESQTSDDARTRFDARLSKAQAVAAKARRSDSAAPASVRAIRTRSHLSLMRQSDVAGEAAPAPRRRRRQ